MMRFPLGLLLFFVVLTSCTTDDLPRNSTDELTNKVAPLPTEEPGDKKTQQAHQVDLLDPEDPSELNMSTAAHRKLIQRLHADALFYTPMRPNVDYTDLDTTAYGSEIDFTFEVTFQNDQLIAIRTTQQWCAAYCDGAVFGTVFSRTDGEVVPPAALFAAPRHLEDFRKRVLSDFKQRLADRIEAAANAPDSTETAMERSALLEYCQEWQPDQFELTQTGLLFNQDCDMPHVIQAFDFNPGLRYPYAEIGGLNTLYFGESQ